MTEKEKILKKIDVLKWYLDKLISEKDSLQDTEIIQVSTLLDSLLNKYNLLDESNKN